MKNIQKYLDLVAKIIQALTVLHSTASHILTITKPDTAPATDPTPAPAPATVAE